MQLGTVQVGVLSEGGAEWQRLSCASDEAPKLVQDAMAGLQYTVLQVWCCSTTSIMHRSAHCDLRHYLMPAGVTAEATEYTI